PQVVDCYADGCDYTGSTTVNLGFADQRGSFQVAFQILGQLDGLGKKPYIFNLPKLWSDFFSELFLEMTSNSLIEPTVQEALGLHLIGKPLFLMPGVYR